MIRSCSTAHWMTRVSGEPRGGQSGFEPSIYSTSSASSTDVALWRWMACRRDSSSESSSNKNRDGMAHAESFLIQSPRSTCPQLFKRRYRAPVRLNLRFLLCFDQLMISTHSLNVLIAEDDHVPQLLGGDRRIHGPNLTNGRTPENRVDDEVQGHSVSRHADRPI